MTDPHQGVSTIDFIQANVGGTLCDARQPAISPLDRGFLYGDALYEVWRTYNGVIFAWDAHWERLRATADGIGLDLATSPSEILREIRRTAAAWRMTTGQSSDLYIRLQISRGAGPIGLDPGLATDQSFVLLVKAQPDLSPQSLDTGLRLAISRNWRRNSPEALPPALKTGNYLNNVQGLREVRKKDADEVLFLNASGQLAETSTRNVWLVFPDRIATPILSDGLLAGVTRRILLEDIREFRGLPLIEESLTETDLISAKECFLSSTTQDVQPVSAIDNHSFNVGQDTLTRALKRQFKDYVNQYAATHSHLNVDL